MESISQSNYTGKRKDIQIRKEEVKLSLFADDIILYMEKHKYSYQKILKLINSVKFQDPKLTYMEQQCSYTLSKLSEKRKYGNNLIRILPKVLKKKKKKNLRFKFKQRGERYIH